MIVMDVLHVKPVRRNCICVHTHLSVVIQTAVTKEEGKSVLSIHPQEVPTTNVSILQNVVQPHRYAIWCVCTHTHTVNAVTITAKWPLHTHAHMHACTYTCTHTHTHTHTLCAETVRSEC